MGTTEIDYLGLPEALRHGARLWIEHGIRPGHFLSAVIDNDLCEAVGRADDKNVLLLLDIIRFWYNEAPETCWGSREKVSEWKKKHIALRAQKEKTAP